MNFVSISDVHIKNDNYLSCNKFRQFLKHPKTLSADMVILIGDVFDFLVGGHSQYLQKFSSSINSIIELSKTKKIIYIEGNHDFHLEHLVVQMVRKGLNQKNFQLIKGHTILNDQDKKIYIGHGDELEFDNYGHRLFKAAVGNKLMSKVAKYIPYRLLSKAGENASGASRRLNDYYYSEIDAIKIKAKYHKYVHAISDKMQVDMVICGHSHVQDYYESNNMIYANNGYVPKSSVFIAYDSGKIQFININ